MKWNNIEEELEEERRLSDPNITEKERTSIYNKRFKRNLKGRDMNDDLFFDIFIFFPLALYLFLSIYN